MELVKEERNRWKEFAELAIGTKFLCRECGKLAVTSAFSLRHDHVMHVQARCCSWMFMGRFPAPHWLKLHEWAQAVNRRLNERRSEKERREREEQARKAAPPGPFIQYAGLDEVRIECPCGMSTCGEGEIVERFRERHKPHTNGKLRDFEPGLGWTERDLQ